MGHEMELESTVRSLLAECRVDVWFGKDARDDFLSFDKNMQENTLALLCTRALRGPLFKPDGTRQA